MNILKFCYLIIFIFTFCSCKNSTIKTQSKINKFKEDSLVYHSFKGIGLKIDTVFENGNISEIRTIYNDTVPNYEELNFYSNGNLSKYFFYNDHGHLMYKRSYDIDGKLIEEDGRPLIQIVINNQNLKVGDSLTLEVLVAKPPMCKYNLFIIGKDGYKHDVFKNVNPCKNVYGKKIIKTGDFLVPIELDFIDTQKSDTIVDKENVSIYVK